MTSGQEPADFQVADLAHISAADLDALLVEEAPSGGRSSIGTLPLRRTWCAVFIWPPHALGQRVHRERYRFRLRLFVADQRKGDRRFVCPPWGLGGERVEMLLLEAMVPRLMAWPQVHRIESQLMLLDDALSRRLPASEYAQVHERYFKSVESLPAPAPRAGPCARGWWKSRIGMMAAAGGRRADRRGLTATTSTARSTISTAA
jgi:hypothetical protein